MVKLSLFMMLVLTVAAAMGLTWRERRKGIGPAQGFAARQKRRIDRWVTAAAIAAVTTMLVLGGLQWLRIWLS
ncbi:hypothetical protein EOD42_24680 [Rhodovarius crocodyli]|uniref:Uncharacterized protein n=2 Tax=Rhodovarius crocodyli TaxID=1979269 RepID=A0A437LX47_9PROT|nr:hypothetical protein EOD42_24680 [Rhodovarius crocodyli]